MSSVKFYPPTQLLQPEQLLHKLEQRPPLAENFSVLEVGSSQQEEYQSGHIPRAVYFDTGEIETSPTWNRLSDRDLERILPEYGITRSSNLLLYGRTPLAPFRLAIILMYAGIHSVAILDGGFDAWQRAGLPLESVPNQAAPGSGFGLSIPAYSGLFTDIEGVRSALSDPGSVVVSVRSWQEYIGATSGYEFIKPRGRIPGAVWGHASTDKDNLEHYQNPDGTLRGLAELDRDWRSWGITPEKKIIFFCGTGWRASAACFFASLLGWENISVFDGGWLEWSSDERNPIAQGDPVIGGEAGKKDQ